MGPAGDAYKALQIHPTRFCNLTCLHCYSSSGPDQREELGAPLLIDAITQARDEGYNDVAFSGGEPILYGELRRLLEHARSMGMVTNLTSNGMLLNGARLTMLEGVTDLLAISLDGIPESHNRMRNSPYAFEHMRANLEGVRKTGIPFGFIFTLTLTNLPELKWVTEFAVEQGASLLQIHPLEEVGRGLTQLVGQRPDEVEAAFAYLHTGRMQADVGAKLAIRIDFLDRELLRPAADRVYAGTCDTRAEDRPLSDMINPLVIEQDGAVVPLQYGFNRKYQVGNLHESSFSDMAATWKKNVFPSFQELCARVYTLEMGKDDLPIFNWYETISRASHGQLAPQLSVSAQKSRLIS
jgi:MoaA/NifB/PqqE/SkfB family radical SAM enzyme